MNDTQITDLDLYLFGEGSHQRIYQKLGAHPTRHGASEGTRFAVWAPNAERVSLVGPFNQWNGEVHVLQPRGSSGVWELFVAQLGVGTEYKYEIRGRDGRLFLKADPYGFAMMLRPQNSSLVTCLDDHTWHDGEWMAMRGRVDPRRRPLNAYEVHLGSWRRPWLARQPPFMSWLEAVEQLIPYAKDMGYTHLELMGVAEHPLDASWGYQVVGYYAVTSRYGAPRDFMHFVDCCHQAGLGVILDWVPAHFPRDAHGLEQFDGTALYEHADSRLGEHHEWGTKVFNYGRHEVRNFLVANALFWADRYHIDGLRVDAVASMLYLDYSRNAGEWLPNRYGGRENLEAIEFIRALNTMAHREFPGVLTIAEESTAWPMVSRPAYVGGLGFSMKWNMGWMNDTLAYLRQDPVHRHYHHALLTFGQLYAYSENFVLPLSHDEVVHGKGSLLAKMPGDNWQKFANLRLLLTYQATLPGKKLGFMGNEFGQWHEWYSQRELDWGLLARPGHRGVQQLVRDLNRLYRSMSALHELDFDSEGFSWIDCHDADQSVISFLRRDRSGMCAVVVLNFTPVPRRAYRIGVPAAGRYREKFNSDSRYYGGSDVGNSDELEAVAEAWMGQPAQLELVLPPLAGLILIPA